MFYSRDSAGSVRGYQQPTGAQDLVGTAKLRGHGFLLLPVPSAIFLGEVAPHGPYEKMVPYRWGENQVRVFAKIKVMSTSASILQNPDWSRPFTLHTDWSKVGVGACLSQTRDTDIFRVADEEPRRVNILQL
jgi:hypothetical protein